MPLIAPVRDAARQMAADQSRTDVVAALSLICIDQSKRDPWMVERVAALKAAFSWTRATSAIEVDSALHRLIQISNGIQFVRDDGAVEAGANALDVDQHFRAVSA
jgi:hypothetical protein